MGSTPIGHPNIDTWTTGLTMRGRLFVSGRGQRDGIDVAEPVGSRETSEPSPSPKVRAGSWVFPVMAGTTLTAFQWAPRLDHAQAKGANSIVTSEPGPSRNGSRPTSGTIVVIEDDEGNRTLLTRILESEGFAVLASGDGEAGLALIETANPDLVVLDIGLPGLDGFELTRRLRLDPGFVTLPILLLTGRSGPSDVVTGLEAGADDFITKPFSREELVARIRSALRLRRALVGMEAAHAVVTALANAVEAKDVQTEHHCERLALLAGRLGTRIGLEPAELDAVTYGALLHDVGKIGVPDHILTKQGPLTEDEWTLVRRHPEIGERICAPLRAFAAFGPIIRHHHERWDGAGYPGMLRGEAIPIGARIVGLVDAFDAITHDRPYRDARTLDHALEAMAKEAGHQFDPDLTRIFADELGRMAGQIEDAPVDAFALLARRIRPRGFVSPFPARGR
jgi:putative two-component system response regulator